MSRTPWLYLALFALAALATLSPAFTADNLTIDGVEAYLHHGEKRQAIGTGRSSSSTPPPTSSPPLSTDPLPVSSEPPKSTNPPESRPPPSSSPAPTSKPSSSRTTAILITTPLVSTSIQAFTSVFTTESNGVTLTQVQVGTRTIPVTTGQVVNTDAPTSQQNPDGNGMTQSNKNIIGGVVGGVGGALLLGGIALVFLRMKKRQHRVREDDDDMTLGTGSALGDKHHSGPSHTPFQSNLEQYHNPGGRPNAAANF